MTYLAPGATAISEFARQQSGTWLNGTCVEASALMCAMALQSWRSLLAPADFGDELQAMVDEWRAEFPADVSPSGASNFVDAADWLRDQGLSALDDVLPDVPDWFAEMQTNIPRGCVYLVGVTNARALPGDENVSNHGLAAFGVDDAGNIICGDPDNWRANVNMPGNPVGQFVTYSRADFSNAAISSLTKVWGKSMWTKQADGWSTDSAGHRAGPGVIGWMTGNELIGHDALAGESPYSAPEANGKAYAWLALDDGTTVVVTRDSAGNYSYRDHMSSVGAVGIEAEHA